MLVVFEAMSSSWLRSRLLRNSRLPAPSTIVWIISWYTSMRFSPISVCTSSPLPITMMSPPSSPLRRRIVPSTSSRMSVEFCQDSGSVSVVETT